jgi:uncharacterized protein (DUF362 family)
MADKLTRRSFIKKSAALGAASLAGSYIIPDFINAADEASIDIASVTGKDYFRNTIEAVNMLGGMGRFMSSGANVAILPNAVCTHPSTALNTNVLLAVIQLCYEAGAKDVHLIKDVADNYWDGVVLSKDQTEMYARVKIADSDYAVLPIENGLALKEAHISKKLMEADVFINLGLIKHHVGTEFTGVLKNLMGACPHEPTNRFFHFGSKASDSEWYSDIDFLSQCIADLNLLRQPDLSIGDSSSFITTNGPFGPGEIVTSDTITAGSNVVSVDAYCTRFLELTADNVAMIGMAAKHDLGEMNLENVRIKKKTS